MSGAYESDDHLVGVRMRAVRTTGARSDKDLACY